MRLIDRIIANDCIDMDFKDDPDEIKEILSALRLQELVIEEIKKCNKDYDRHEIPVDWNNVSCTGTVESILQSLVDKAKTPSLSS